MAGLTTDTKLLLNFNNNVLDTGLGPNCPHTPTNVNVTFSDVIKKWGYSGVFNGANAYVTFLDSADWDIVKLNTDDRNIDMWVRLTVRDGNDAFVGQFADNNNWWLFYHNKDDGLTFRVWQGGDIIELHGGVISDDGWYHVLFAKKADKYGLYLAGQQTAYVQDASVKDITAPLWIGGYPWGGVPTDLLTGNIDELRNQHENDFGADPQGDLSDTIVPPTAPYSVPAVGYPVSALNKNRITGYHCFMDAYMRAKKAGLTPLKLPDGTVF